MSYPERLAIETQEGEEPFLPEIQHTRGCSGQPLHASWQKASGWTEVGGVQRLHYQGAVFLPQMKRTRTWRRSRSREGAACERMQGHSKEEETSEVQSATSPRHDHHSLPSNNDEAFHQFSD
ncbi:hypothetical protein PVAP13_9KG045400 [Panicum virgatum]|uniref:Uncharacterized protein n=1 Tax=Panicum virgatum TaxID=38727 RepID=A0A8T0NC02_PANVG|nr:hypothetical protein PVAP13_9KG045400 [Panicum virgatum]